MNRRGSKMNSRIKRRTNVLIVPVIAVFVLLSAWVRISACQADDSWVATVNGEPVATRLFQRRVTRNRARAHIYFGQHYGATDSADFWTTSFGGEVPLDWVRRRALDECVRFKLQQMLARENGLLQDISYTAFLESLARENERRSRALEAGEPIYGPTQYREDEYFLYVFTNMVIELKRRLGERPLAPTDEEVRAHYEAVKDELYARQDRVTVQIISVPFRDMGSRPQHITREEARPIIEVARGRLEAGDPFEELAREYNEDRRVAERTFDEDSRRFDERRTLHLREEAMKLSPGETSGIFEENNTFYIFRCTARSPVGYMPFEEVALSVRAHCVGQRYEDLIAELVRDVAIEINRSAYDQVQVR